MRGIDHADPLQHHHPYRAGLPRHPTQDTTTATRTTHQHAPGRDRPWATPTAATGPEDMRHTHPTIRSRRSPPERPTAHTRTATHTHSRQAVSSPHTHAQPRQPPRASPPADTTHPHQPRPPRPRSTRAHDDTSSTTTVRAAHNALTSTNTKNHATEITTNTKTNTSNPRE